MTASSHGMVSSGTLDQSQVFQDFLNICFNEKIEAVVDVQILDCAGADIWVNPDGTAFSANAGQAFTMRGATRRSTEVRNAYMTFGKFYRLVNGVVTYDITRDPCYTFRISDLHFIGCTRFVNIEGAPIVENCSFFATSMSGFYSAFPANWGIGNGVSIATPYTSITHVVETMACNHLQWFNNNTQDGNLYGLELGGILASQCGNMNIIGGRINACDRALEFNVHPVYGIRVSDTVHLIGMHFESNTKEAIKLAGATQANIQGHIRGSAANWDRANYPLMRIETASSRDIQVNSFFTGVDSSSGVAISANSVTGLTVEGHFKRFMTIANLESGVRNYKFDRVSYEQIRSGTEFVIAASVTPWRKSPSVAENVTPVGVMAGLASLNDDFLGDTLNGNWSVFKGSDGACVDFALAGGAGGIISATTGAAGSGTMALNGVQLVWAGLNFLASPGSVSMIWRAKVDNISAVAVFVGLTDLAASLEMPATYSGTTLTANATDCVGFLYDTQSTNDKWVLVGVKNGTPVVKETLVAPVSDTFVSLRIDIDSAGIANYYINGVIQSAPELVTNGGFATDTDWTKGTDWAIDTEILGAVHTAGSTDTLSQAVSVIAGQTYTLRFRVGSRTAGSITASLTGGTPVTGTTRSVNLPFEEDFVAASGNTTLTFTPTSAFNGNLYDVSLIQKGITNAVTVSAPLSPTVAGFSYNVGASRIISADAISIEQARQ